MPDYYLARQPIYDSQLNVFGYELLYRAADTSQAPSDLGDEATYQVLGNALNEIGLDTLVGSGYALLNITEAFVIGDKPLPFSGDKIILEVLEDVRATDAVLHGIRRLRKEGYTIALDDFVYEPSLRELVSLTQIIKVDILVHDRAGLAQQVAALKPLGVKLLAEKVETQEEFNFCRELGFDYFQGYFFCQPQVIQGKRIPSNHMATVRLLSKVNDPDITYDELCELISHDVSLSIRLLRYANSAFFARPQKIDSLQHAVTYLGLNLIRQWVTVLTMSGVNDKPHELLVTALIRARMCQQLAAQQGLKNKDSCFLIGLLSILDALLDSPMDELLSNMSFSDDITLALSEHQGKAGQLLEAVIHFQQGKWEEADASCSDVDAVNTAYLEALNWLHEIEGVI